VLDPAARDYRVAGGEVAPEVAELLKIRAPAEKLARLRASTHPQAQFLWAIFRDLFHYSAYHLAEVADNARDVDLAIRWGFGWQMGPFETWQAAGWKEVAGWVAVTCRREGATGYRCRRGRAARGRSRARRTRAGRVFRSS
jgi:3-hydroxyacyl-CoA dehydrogenase